MTERTNPRAAAARVGARRAAVGAELLAVLEAQLAGNRELRALVDRKRDAIRIADIDAVSAICEAEHVVVQRLGEQEKLRLALVGRCTAALDPDADAPLGLAAIADAMDGDLADRLRTTGATLREELAVLRRESSIVRQAADALSQHLAGLVQTLYGALSRVGVYERRGRIAVGSQMEFCVDVKT